MHPFRLKPTKNLFDTIMYNMSDANPVVAPAELAQPLLLSTNVRKSFLEAIELINQEQRIQRFHEKTRWVDKGNGKGHYKLLNMEILHKEL
jgi:hypothetical protein